MSLPNTTPVADDCAPCGHAWSSHVHGAGCTVPACGCNRWKFESAAPPSGDNGEVDGVAPMTAVAPGARTRGESLGWMEGISWRELEDANKRAERAERAVVDYQHQAGRFTDSLIALATQRDALRSWILERGRWAHDHSCPVNVGYFEDAGKPCTCGLSDALAPSEAQGGRA